jgi:hypothetical protein
VRATCARVRDEVLALGLAARAMLYRVHDSPWYWLIRAVRSSVWCLAYIVGTYSLRQRTPEREDRWDFSEMPYGLHLIVMVSIWSTLFDFLFELLAGGGARFLASFGALTSVLTMPVFFLAIGWFALPWPEGSRAARWAAGYGALSNERPWLALDVRPHYFLLQFG